MRKWGRITAAVAGSVLLAGGAAAATGSLGTYLGFPEANVQVGGVAVNSDVPAIIVNGRTLVSLRFVAQALGATVTWDPTTTTAQVQPNLVELVTAASVTEPVSAPSSTMVGTAAAAGSASGVSQSFAISTNPNIDAYAILWDDGASHSYTFVWTDSKGNTVKSDPVQMQDLSQGLAGLPQQAPYYGPGLGWVVPQSLTGLPSEVILEDPLALEPPFSQNQSLLPDAGLYYVTLERDGTPIAKNAFLLTR